MDNKPYVFCHMETSLDGKIMGRFWSVLRDLDEPFYELAFGDNRAWDHQGWISGRITTDDNFTNYAEPELLPGGGANVPAGDFIIDADKKMYYISIDRRGVLGWKEDYVHYKTTNAKVIEVLSDLATDEYKGYLRRLNIPYIVCGEDSVDFELMLEKLRESFGMNCIMLGGGGVVNWSMIQQGLVDEISVVVDPSSDGSIKTQTLFMAAEGLSNNDPVRFHVKDVQRVGTGGERVWLRYTVQNS